MIRYITAFLLFPIFSMAQNYGYFAGARSASLAHSSVAISDVWAAHHNQAALAYLEKPSVGVSFEKRYFLSDLSLGNVAFAYPSKLGTIGFSVSYFGFDLYNESKFGLNYSRSFGKYFSFGLQLNYHDYYVEEGIGSPSALTFEAGVLAKPIKKLSLGFHIFNPTASTKNIETEERLPLIARLGALYQVGDDLMITAEVKKHENAKERYAAGVEYQLLEALVFRTGVGVQPLTNTFGLGLKLGWFTTDLSYEYAQVLGSNANISLQYAF